MFRHGESSRWFPQEDWWSWHTPTPSQDNLKHATLEMPRIAMVRTRSFNKTISAPLVGLLIVNVPFQYTGLDPRRSAIKVYPGLLIHCGSPWLCHPQSRTNSSPEATSKNTAKDQSLKRMLSKVMAFVSEISLSCMSYLAFKQCGPDGQLLFWCNYYEISL